MYDNFYEHYLDNFSKITLRNRLTTKWEIMHMISQMHCLVMGSWVKLNKTEMQALERRPCGPCLEPCKKMANLGQKWNKNFGRTKFFLKQYFKNLTKTDVLVDRNFFSIIQHFFLKFLKIDLTKFCFQQKLFF